MKRVDMFCASQASTAICMSMDEGSSSTILLGGRAIDRHNPIIRDARRTTKSLTGACSSSQLPITPKPRPNHQKTRKNSSKPTDLIINKNNSAKPCDQKRKSSAKPTDSIKKNCAKPTDLITRTPPGSSRYLLSDSAFFDVLSDFEPDLALVPAEPKKSETVKTHESTASNPSSSSDQVVVLRVSLHCKGCEGKVRKHISRMEGVTSFDIDFASKKVTVIGDVTPLGVLASVSKVKSAQLWTPAQSSSQPSSISSSHPKIKK